MFRFTIRDVLWLTVVVALGIAWMADRRHLLNEFGKESPIEATVYLEALDAAVFYDDGSSGNGRSRVGVKHRSVNMVGFNSDEFPPDALPHLKALPKLKRLVIQGPLLSDSNLDELSELTQLEELELGRCGITDNGTRRLAGLANLQQLGLYNNPVGDDGIVALASLKSLKELNLARTNVTRNGVDRLLSQSHSIRKIDVEGCERLEKREVALLRDRFPAIEIFD